MIKSQTFMIMCALIQGNTYMEQRKQVSTCFVCVMYPWNTDTWGNILDESGKTELLEHNPAPFPWQPAASQRLPMWMNNAICAERKPLLIIHKLLYPQSCVSTAFLCMFGLLMWEGVPCSKASRSTLKSVVLGAINILVFIFPAARKIITYRWNIEFAS